MLGRLFPFTAALVSLVCLALAIPTHAQEAPVMRIRDLASHLQAVVTIQGRTGFIVEHYEKQHLHAFTLRDDYNDQIVVRMTDREEYPVMGVTYRVTGWAARENGDLILDTLPGQVVPAYSSAPPPPSLPRHMVLLLWAAGAVLGIATLAAIGYALRRAASKTLPEWGELTVASGPDKGRTISLRRRRIQIGRGVSGSRGVRLSGGDPTISNRHGELSYKGGVVSYRDLSRNGSRIGGERLKMGEPTRVNSGDLIHLGTLGTVIIVRQRDIPAVHSFWSNLRETSTTSDQTLMYAEPVEEEPFWRRQANSIGTQVSPEFRGDMEAVNDEVYDVEAGEDLGEESSAHPVFTFVAIPPRDQDGPGAEEHTALEAASEKK